MARQQSCSRGHSLTNSTFLALTCTYSASGKTKLLWCVLSTFVLRKCS